MIKDKKSMRLYMKLQLPIGKRYRAYKPLQKTNTTLKKLLGILLCVVSISCATKESKTRFNDIIIDKKMNSNLFTSTDVIPNPLTLKTGSGYDNIPDSTQYLIKSNAIVNNDSLRLMRFAVLKRNASDTLELIIYETNPAHHQNLTFKIANNKFISEFNYSMSGPPLQIKIKTLEQELTLTSIPKQKGEVMYGKFYYKGMCEFDCEGEIEIKGDFKAELQ